MLAPSKAAPAGCWPTLNSAGFWLIAYHRSVATDSGVASCPHKAGDIAAAAAITTNNLDLFMELSYNAFLFRGECGLSIHLIVSVVLQLKDRLPGLLTFCRR